MRAGRVFCGLCLRRQVRNYPRKQAIIEEDRKPRDARDDIPPFPSGWGIKTEPAPERGRGGREGHGRRYFRSLADDMRRVAAETAAQAAEAAAAPAAQRLEEVLYEEENRLLEDLLALPEEEVEDTSSEGKAAEPEDRSPVGWTPVALGLEVG
eukprot:Hpha_TRINITY_DN178_c0_g1::TRINITY_DN178_c0_g1_i2::g.82191::m.82191